MAKKHRAAEVYSKHGLLQSKGTIPNPEDLPAEPEDGDTFYCAQDGCVYVYDKRIEDWVYYDGESGIL